MLELYIKIQNGLPVDHPQLKDNILDAYELSDTDLDGHPDWLPFIRVEKPYCGVYETAGEPHYVRDGMVVNEQWIVRSMTDAEKVIKQNRVKFDWAQSGGPSNWIFDEEKCGFIPPLPYPDDGAPYIWVQEANKWVELSNESAAHPMAAASSLNARPPYPNFEKGIDHPDHDGIFYDFDEATNSWVPMTNPAQEFPSDHPHAHVMIYNDATRSWEVSAEALATFQSISPE